MLSVASTLRGNRAVTARLSPSSSVTFRCPPHTTTLFARTAARSRSRFQSTVAIEENTVASPSHIHATSARTGADFGLHSYSPKAILMEPIQIVRLPEMRASEPKESGKFADHQLPEQMAVMYACLATGEMERARRILLTLYKNNPDDMLVLGDIRMHNSFLEAYMNAQPSPRTKEALKWFESLTKYQVKPDLTSFAILIKGFTK